MTDAHDLEKWHRYDTLNNCTSDGTIALMAGEEATNPFDTTPNSDRLERLRVAKKAERLFDRLDVPARLKNGSWGNVLEALCKAIVVAVEEENLAGGPEG